jgi:polysaccharide biosynthesis protein PslH
MSLTHRVHVLFISEVTHQFEASTLLQNHPAEYIWRIDASAWPYYRWRSRIRAFFPLFALLSNWISTNWMPDTRFTDLLNRLDLNIGKKIQPTHVVVFKSYSHAFAGAITQQFPDAKIELDMDDYESQTHFSIAGAQFRLGNYLRGVLFIIAGIQYRFVERVLARHYETVYLAAQCDSVSLSSRLSLPILFRRNRINTIKSHPLTGAVKTFNMIFVGTLTYAPNEEAVRFICYELLPLLEKNLSGGWRITVIGRIPPAPLVRALKANQRITFISDAENLAPWYESASAVLVPLYAGGGTKLKVLEALAYERPVISTLHGVRDLGAVDGQHYLNAETSDEFVQAITKLMESFDLARRIGTAGHQLGKLYGGSSAFSHTAQKP